MKYIVLIGFKKIGSQERTNAIRGLTSGQFAASQESNQKNGTCHYFASISYEHDHRKIQLKEIFIPRNAAW